MIPVNFESGHKVQVWICEKRNNDKSLFILKTIKAQMLLNKEDRNIYIKYQKKFYHLKGGYNSTHIIINEGKNEIIN